MMSFYGHDNCASPTSCRPLIKTLGASSSPLEPSSAITSTPDPPVSRPAPNTTFVKSALSSPASSATSSTTSSPRVSHGVETETSLAENSPHTPEHRLLTPPSSTRVLRTTVPLPRPISPPAPTTLADTCSMIAAFINSGHTRPLSITLTPDLWTAFLEARDNATHGTNSFLPHLRFTYDARSSTLITRCMPSPLHDAVQVFFDRRLKRLIIERRLSYTDSTRFAVQSGTDVGRFTGDRAGSRKQPDMAVMATGDDLSENGLNGDFPLGAVEVGFSEGYEGLMKDMELWLVGSEGKVRVVVVINLTETPSYTVKRFLNEDEKPQHTSTDAEEAVNQTDHDDDTGTSAPPVVPIRVNPPFGPYMHKGIVLVGQITGFLELWRLDATTSLPVRTVHRDIFPSGPPPHADDTFELTMLDLFGWPDRLPAGCAPDEPVVFELAEYRDVVAQAVLRFARMRLHRVAEKRKVAAEPDKEWRGGKRRRV